MRAGWRCSRGKESGNFLAEWSTVDISAGVRADNWSLTAYFENVFDESYYAADQLVVPPAGYIPRIFGVRDVRLRRLRGSRPGAMWNIRSALPWQIFSRSASVERREWIHCTAGAVG